MAKKRPTASHRNIAEAIESLPRGEYAVTVEANDHRPYLRIEGSRILFVGDVHETRVMIVPIRADRQQAA